MGVVAYYMVPLGKADAARKPNNEPLRAGLRTSSSAPVGCYEFVRTEPRGLRGDSKGNPLIVFLGLRVVLCRNIKARQPLGGVDVQRPCSVRIADGLCRLHRARYNRTSLLAVNVNLPI